MSARETRFRGQAALLMWIQSHRHSRTHLPEGFPCQGTTMESFSRSYFSMKKPKTIFHLTISHEDIITRDTVPDSEELSE